ncbi:hypothetical protein ABQF35_11095 [Mycobacterium syngnathidarum]
MSGPARIARLAALAIVTASLASCGQDTHPAKPNTSAAKGTLNTATPSVFAFTTDNGLSLVRDGAVISTVATSSPPRHPVFTTSGEYVAATADDGSIVITGLDAESSRTIAAHATQVFADRGDTIAWWQGPDQLVSLDLSQPSSAPTSTVIGLPGGNPENTRLLSMADGIAVFARPDGSDGSEELIRMDRYQTFGSLGPSPETAHPIQITVPSPDGREFAYQSPIRAACPKSGVGVIDTQTGQFSSPALPSSIDNVATASTMWWDTDRALHIALATRPCGSDASSNIVTTWKLDQDEWIRADPADVLASRALAGGQTALVTPTSTKPPRGTLWVDTGATRVQVADDVTDLATPAAPIPNE